MKEFNLTGPICQRCCEVFSGAPAYRPFDCQFCGKIFVRVPHGPDCIFYAPGKISDDCPTHGRIPGWKIRKLVWQRGRGDGRIYFPCSLCGHVLSLLESDVCDKNIVWQPSTMQDGRNPYPCVKCDDCSCHTWPYFEGFTESKETAVAPGGAHEDRHD